MKYKKIYIEITNICNLNCSFCAKNHRKPEFMSLENFKIILKKIKNYTKYLYLHVMGEPLCHPEINQFIKLAVNQGFKVNITTNGTLIDNLKEDSIRQLNISLHSFALEDNQLDTYLNPIFAKAAAFAEKGTFINYRLWVMNDKTALIINRLQEQYHVTIHENDKTKTLAKNIFYSREGQFIWPIDRQEWGNLPSYGNCRALKDHIAILVDGTIVPCCLDNEASIPLGNIFKDDLESVIYSSVYQELLLGFSNNQKIHPFCQKCDFYDSKLS